MRPVKSSQKAAEASLRTTQFSNTKNKAFSDGAVGKEAMMINAKTALEDDKYLIDVISTL